MARVTVPEKGAVSFGSGTLVDVRGQFGLVVTNWHVVRDNAGGPILVEFPGGFKSPAQVVKLDSDWDLAALSIARPPVAPVPITAVVPQLGEWLTIAGYGGGDYRAAGGTLANYVSPSPDLPTEMLDIARVEARQGDSGGPILNQRGELCGVLFGASHGSTNGSHGGRVLNFLVSVVPGGVPGSDAPGAASLTAAAPPAATAPQPTALHQPPVVSPPGTPPLANGWAPRQPAADSLAELKPLPSNPLPQTPLLSPPPPGELEQRYGAAPAAEPTAVAMRVAPAVAAEADETAALIHSSLPPRVAVGTETGAGLGSAPPSQLAAVIWKRIGGTTAVDQGKTILALIGILSLLIFGWRLSSRQEPEVEEE